jgi:hypothetical protein
MIANRCQMRVLLGLVINLRLVNFRTTNVPILSTKAPKNVDLRMVPSLTGRPTPPPFHATADVERLAAVGNRVERSLHRAPSATAMTRSRSSATRTARCRGSAKQSQVLVLIGSGGLSLAGKRLLTPWRASTFRTSFETSERIPAENATSSPVVPPPTVGETGAADSDHAAEAGVGNYDHTTHASPDKTPHLSWQHKRLSLRSHISFPKR